VFPRRAVLAHTLRWPRSDAGHLIRPSLEPRESNVNHSLSDLAVVIAVSLIMAIMVAVGGAATTTVTSTETWTLEPTNYESVPITCREAT
jgi:hypothetical protein